MTTDTKATYYDLDINGATVETKDIVRAVLERAGLGADASHQLGKVLERCIRLGAKPGTNVAREVEKIHIEAGMLRDAASPDEHRGLTADDAREWRGLRARIAELERERDEWIESSEGWRKDVEHWHQEANDQATRAMAAERELAGVVDPEQLQRWRTALSASPTETLTNAICRVTSELAEARALLAEARDDRERICEVERENASLERLLAETRALLAETGHPQ